MARNRMLALAFVAAFLGLLRWLAPAPAERAIWLYLIVLPLGYGHVIGAAVFSRVWSAPARVPVGARLLYAAFLGTSLLSLAALYGWALGSPALQPFVLGPILLLFGWHIVENDLALGRSYREGLRLGPLLRGRRANAIALALTLGAALAAFSTREGALFSRAYFGAALLPVQDLFTFDDLAAGFVLYHTLTWLLFFEDRARALRRSSLRDAARLRRRVLAFHLVPLLVNAALYRRFPAVSVWAAAPALYFLWSALHAVHTAKARGLAPRPARA